MERFVFSSDWAAFLEYIEEQIRKDTHNLTMATETVDIYRLQGTIRAYKKLAELKERVRANREG